MRRRKSAMHYLDRFGHRHSISEAEVVEEIEETPVPALPAD